MNDKTFRDFIARMNQIGQVAHIVNPLQEPMHCQVKIGDGGGAILITLPPGGELRFVVSAYDMVCHMERPAPAQTPSKGDWPSG